MADSDRLRLPVLAAIRILAQARDISTPPVASLPPALGPLLDALDPAAARVPAATATLAQRLGDARTLGLLEAADPSLFGVLLRDALRASEAAVRRIPADAPEPAARGVERIRAGGCLRLGGILVAQGLVGPRRLQDALEAQCSTGRRIGAELVACRQLAAREVAEALWLQHKLVASAAALAAAWAAAEPGVVRLVPVK